MDVVVIYYGKYGGASISLTVTVKIVNRTFKVNRERNLEKREDHIPHIF